MSAARKISDAEIILAKLKNSQEKSEFENFIKTIHDVFSHLLDEYNVKFGLKINKIGLEKFKTVAKRAGKIDAINFLIWYEKEYKKLRNDPEIGKYLEREYQMPQDMSTTCTRLLDETRKIAYYAYENF
jgi:hypothetical protein